MRTMLSFLVLAFFVAGCGYKGPLYLPKPKPAAQKSAPAAPAQPAAGKPDDGTAKE